MTGNGRTLFATTCNEFFTHPDTQISVYCGDCGNLTCVAGNDDDCVTPSNLLSTVTWCSEVGTEYLILVHGFLSSAGDFTLIVGDDGVSCTNPTACGGGPPHDECAGCIPVATNQPISGSTLNATGTDITSCTLRDTADVWHCWQADCTGTAVFSLCGSSFDTSLAVFNDCGGQELACDDNGCVGTPQSQLSLPVTAGTTYFVRVAGSLGSVGNYTLNITCGSPPFVEHDFFADTTALIQLQGGPFGAVPVPYVLRGPAQVDVFFDGPNEGTATDDDANGRDEVRTELVSMDLTDGTVKLSVNPNRPSPGIIEEQVNNTPGTLDLDPFAAGDADSFFDVFVEIDVAGAVFHNEEPLRIQSVITEKPPIARYFHLMPATGPIELFDAFNRPTGVFIVKAEHFTGHVEVDQFDFSIGQFELLTPTGGTEVVAMRGPVTVEVFFEGGQEGTASDDDGDGLEDVQTEMVQLQLSGNSATLGPVEVRLNPAIPSTGQIGELMNNTPGTLDVAPFTPTGSADSFFDVFFEVTLPEQGLVLHSVTPKRMRSRIAHKPPGPGALYENVEQIALLDPSGRPSGFFLGATRHRPSPPVEVDQFDFSIGQFELLTPTGGTEVVAM
ncbi:MAG: hypothetical protein ACE5EX_08330, partial [Phycisphaerae bacterium]